MKHFLIFLSLVAILSCSDNSKVKVCTVSGTVQNNPADFILLSEMSGSDTIFLKEDGSFLFEKQLEQPGNYYLQVNKKYTMLYLEPGKSVEVTADAENFDGSVAFSGDLASENAYNRKIESFNRESGRISRVTYMSEPGQFLTTVSEMRKAKEQLLNDFITENQGMSENFINSELLSYEYSYYSSLLNYEEAHLYYAKVDNVTLPEDWYSFINNIDLNNPDLIENPSSQSVLGNIITRKVTEANGPAAEELGRKELLAAQFEWINANITNRKVADHFLYSNIVAVIDLNGPFGIEDQLQIYNEISADEENKSALAEMVAKWAPLTPGKAAPGFTLPDINGDNVSLSDFAGKYVYIDFWATWCGPCKIEIPVLETLSEEYKDKNIVIVSISVDKNKQAWVDMVTKDKPEWLQLHDSINMNDDYLVKYIPTFVLLDREGKIINPRAPKPSSGEKLTNLLNSLEGI